MLPTDDALPSGLNGVDAFLIARLNDSSSYFFTWFCKRYRIRIGDQDVGGKLEIQRCPICLDTCTKSIELQCGHAFCRPCLTTAAANKITSCALCRREQVINPELLRAQFDKQRMLNLAQRLAIPAPPRPRPPTSGISTTVNFEQKLDLEATAAVKGEGKSVKGSDKTASPSSSAESMTTHGHLLFGPWGDVGAMTPQELRRRWTLSNPTADVGAMPVKKLISSWQELQRLSRASAAVSAVEHGASDVSPIASTSSQPSQAAHSTSTYDWPGDGFSPHNEAPCASLDGLPKPAVAITSAEICVGVACPGELSARWRALVRVPPATGFRRPSSITCRLSVGGSADVQPQVTSAIKPEHTLPITCTRGTDTACIKFGDGESDIMTCSQTVGSLTVADLRQRWNQAFQSVDSDVGAMSVNDLAARLAVARGPQGVGGVSSTNLAERWFSTTLQHAEDRQEEGHATPLDEYGLGNGPQLDCIIAPIEGSGVVDADRVTDEGLAANTVMKDKRFLSASNPVSPTSCQDVGAASMSTLRMRWHAARVSAAPLS